jgi:hypothetical protein
MDDENNDDVGGADKGRIALARRADILAVTKEIGDPMLRASLLSSAAVATPTKTSERSDLYTIV